MLANVQILAQAYRRTASRVGCCSDRSARRRSVAEDRAVGMRRYGAMATAPPPPPPELCRPARSRLSTEMKGTTTPTVIMERTS